MDKRGLSERDVCTKFITPAIVAGGWDAHLQLRENVYLTKGRVIVRGKLVTRGEAKFADYVLYFKPNLPLAIVEAKDNNHGVGAGMQQALGYAEMIDVPFVFSSNGDGFLFHDRTGLGPKVEQELGLDAFPSPEELWQRYRAWKGLTTGLDDVLLRRARLHVLAEARNRGRVPRALQGRAHRPRQGCLRVAARARQARQARRGDRGPRLQPARLRPHARPREADGARRAEGDELPRRDRPVRQDDRVLRGHRSRRAHAPGARERERGSLRAEPPVRDADHGRQPGGEGGARQLHPPRGALPRDRDDLEADDDRRRREDVQGDRPRPDDPLDDRVQADHRARHAHRGGLREALLHDHRLPARDGALRRPRLRRRAGAGLRAG